MRHARRAAEQLEHAEECLRIAALLPDESGAAYLRMAELYRALAAEEIKLQGSGLPLA
jgi:hypothetical protein